MMSETQNEWKGSRRQSLRIASHLLRLFPDPSKDCLALDHTDETQPEQNTPSVPLTNFNIGNSLRDA